ncbi:UPF0496 protein [Arabidopsis thaliana]|uniref:UPF0496 protein At1g20180 n=4 Tax=Arabidopsis TaxID=3701 RepID=U496K_ARATH|nr:transmembrane protein (DUF677) [Arabidopsis thaliana]Q6DYE5.2 RecName: Full=UPF0496 protein At1g20180 [Arabidopsis thaliana]KAG7646964.1 hypothetical protein ISN45_At01g020450 [Arabidopsis thaliana x Arabidopsis arenosa]KAG7654936.1 hypothetical protein ISN44_As01g020580 [Arabidopsis suecica]AAF79896.1 Contains similarity to At14a protein from Arabidopsis thaliana gi/4589123 [Arabidopsis thaliana]ABE65635.1 hypothetical protein At1g20180 [Arabidopsis thaliana]AEE29947.1 transmembrane prote|eukprot:NP_173445.2 transmembrane protein (DUF677) [Arabidopsis thaliana]
MLKVKNFLGSRLKSFPTRKGKSDKECCRSLTSKLSVNEEYKEAFRTNSYLETRTKAEDQLGITSCSKLSSSSPSPSSSSDLSFHSHFTDYLLDPPQETLDALMQDSSLDNLIVTFFDLSSEACDVCETLLQCLQQIKINHNKIKRVMKIGKRVCNGAKTLECSPEMLCALIFQELSRFAALKNPLCRIVNEAQFRIVHDANSDLLTKLTSKKRRIRRKIRFFKFCKKLGGYSLVITHSAIVITLLIIALHSILGVFAAPALLGLCSFCLLRKKKAKGRMHKSNKDTTLEKLGTQIDIAAKGMFILINDLDTLSRLAGRLCDEIEHRKTVAAMCAKSRKIEVLKEALREFNGHEEKFSDQLQELEEHLYLCFHTINRSRRLVLAQITGQSS